MSKSALVFFDSYSEDEKGILLLFPLEGHFELKYRVLNR